MRPLAEIVVRIREIIGKRFRAARSRIPERTCLPFYPVLLIGSRTSTARGFAFSSAGDCTAVEPTSPEELEIHLSRHRELNQISNRAVKAGRNLGWPPETDNQRSGVVVGVVRLANKQLSKFDGCELTRWARPAASLPVWMRYHL